MTTISFLGAAHIHVPGFVGMTGKRPDFKVAAVYDADPARRNYWADKCGARAVATPHEALDADGLVVCSQTDRHEDLVAAAVTAKKPLFVEKPLGMAAADAYAMADLIEHAGVTFQTGYFQRSDPGLRRIKQLIDTGALGRVSKAMGSNRHSGALGDWFKKKPETPAEDWNWMTEVKHSGVGAFGDLGTHALDILLWWLGEAKCVTAQTDSGTQTYTCDESGQGLLRMTSGATATLTAGWIDIADPVKYLVSGTEGFAAVIGAKLYVTDKDGKLDLNKPETELPPPAPHAFELFLDAVAGREPMVPLVTVREAAYRSAVMEALYEGAARNEWVEPKR